MEKVYFDAPVNECVGVIWQGRQVVFAGLSVHQEPARYRGSEVLAPFLQEDFHFFFEDEQPDLPIYAVPRILILGHDSAGGYFASTRMDVSLNETFPLYYLAKNGGVYQVEGDSRELLSGTFQWRECMRPSDAVKLYPSREMAQRDFCIHDLRELHLPGTPNQ